MFTKKHLTLLFIFFWTIASTQSPYEINWKYESFYLGGGVLTSGAGIYIGSQTKTLAVNEINLFDRNDLNSFDRDATFNSAHTAEVSSDLALLGSFVLPLGFLTHEKSRKDFGKISLMYTEVLFINTGLTFLTKTMVLRTRPLVYNENFSLEEKQKKTARYSFFSGHTSTVASNSFFVAKVFADHYPHSKFKPFVWGTAAIIPALTGFWRVKAGKHFPTDVITGYAVGAAIGFLIPHFHKKSKKIKAFSNLHFSMGTNSAYLSWKF